MVCTNASFYLEPQIVEYQNQMDECIDLPCDLLYDLPYSVTNNGQPFTFDNEGTCIDDSGIAAFRQRASFEKVWNELPQKVKDNVSMLGVEFHFFAEPFFNMRTDVEHGPHKAQIELTTASGDGSSYFVFRVPCEFERSFLNVIENSISGEFVSPDINTCWLIDEDILARHLTAISDAVEAGACLCRYNTPICNH